MAVVSYNGDPRRRRRRSMRRRVLLAIIPLLSLLVSAQAQSISSRWGAASVLLGKHLIIHGGKTNGNSPGGGGYTFNSGPNTDEMWTLDMSAPFAGSSAPWQFVNRTQASSSASPSVAFHSLDVVGNNQLLLFGGEPDTSNASPSENGSAYSVELSNGGGHASYASLPSSYDQPSRTMYLSSDGNGQGQVYLVGGMSTTGSQQPYDSLTTIDMGAQNPSFESSKATPMGGVYGGTATLLDDGTTLLSLGGVCTNGSLQSFDTLAYYSTSAKAWSTVPASGATLPSPRRGHVAVSLPNKRIFMHGGASSDLTVAMADAWILDWSQSPPTWSQISADGSPSARFGHSAIAYGSKVAVSFGWAANNPADTSIYIFDASAMQAASRSWSGGQWTTSYTPDPNVTPASQNSGTGTGNKASSSTTGPSASKSTKSTQNPFQTPSGNAGQGDSSESSSSAGTKAGAALGSLIGLGLVAGVGMYAYRRRQSGEWRGHLVGGKGHVAGGNGSSESGGMVLLGGHRHYDGPDELYTLEKGYAEEELAGGRRGYEPGMHPMGPRQPSRPNVTASPWSLANIGQSIDNGRPQLRQKLAMLTGMASSSPSANQQRFDMLADEDVDERGDAYAMRYTNDLGKHHEEVDEEQEEEDEDEYHRGQNVTERRENEYHYGQVDQDNWYNNEDYNEDRINSAGPGGAAEIYGARIDRDIRRSFDEDIYAADSGDLAGPDSSASHRIDGITTADSGPSSLSNSSNNIISFSDAPVRRQGASPLIKRSPTWWDKFMGQSFLERSASGRMLPGPRADEPIRDPTVPPPLEMIRETGRSANVSAISDPFADANHPPPQPNTTGRVGVNEAAVKSAYSIASIRRMTDGYDPNAQLYIANPDKRRGSSHTTATSNTGRSDSQGH